jgi:hypothetical protein
MQKVIFFTVAALATTEELAAIAALNGRAAAPLEVVVRNGGAVSVGDDFGTDRLEPCDYVAGTVPTAYNAKAALPAGVGVANGAALPVRNSAASKTVNGAAVVAGGVVTSIDLPATAALITSAQAVTIGAETFTFTVAAGVITAIVVS